MPPALEKQHRVFYMKGVDEQALAKLLGVVDQTFDDASFAEDIGYSAPDFSVTVYVLPSAFRDGLARLDEDERERVATRWCDTLGGIDQATVVSLLDGIRGICRFAEGEGLDVLLKCSL